MGQVEMALSDTKIKNLKPGLKPSCDDLNKPIFVETKKPYRVSDEKGLYIEVSPSGSKYWRLKYRHLGKEKRLAIGVYPDVTLAKAREARDEARKLLTQGIDPSRLKQRIKNEKIEGSKNTFKALAEEWYDKQLSSWAKSTAEKRRGLLKNDLYPWLGNSPIEDLDTHDLLKALQRIEDRGAIDTAHNARQILNQVFRYAKQTRRVKENPAIDLAGAIRPKATKHRPAIIQTDEFGKLLTAIDSYNGHYVTRCLLKLCPLLFQRPGEMIAMKWDEIDWDSAVWHLPAEKMKMSIAHDVPLAEQAVEILTELKQLTGNRAYVFPNARDPRRHASPATINNALQKLGYNTQKQHCAHGFRASARTILEEVLGYEITWIEQQLAHQVRDSLGRAYNRTKHLPQRAEMMQQWADYLEKLRLNIAFPCISE